MAIIISMRGLAALVPMAMVPMAVANGLVGLSGAGEKYMDWTVVVPVAKNTQARPLWYIRPAYHIKPRWRVGWGCWRACLRLGGCGEGGGLKAGWRRLGRASGDHLSDGPTGAGGDVGDGAKLATTH